jgi:hypothetical protein
MVERVLTDEIELGLGFFEGPQDIGDKIVASKTKLLEYLLFEKETGKTPTEQFCGNEDAIKLTVFELSLLYERLDRHLKLEKLDPLDD